MEKTRCFVGLGVRPNERLEEVPLMPKARYKIMRNYMPKRGARGLEMMHSTCTVQANLDYKSEQDMIDKTRLAVKIQPIVTALFANSPFYEGVSNGYESLRRHIWTDTDPDRCGVLKVALKEDFCFGKYVDSALSVPMYFIVREDKHIDCSGKSFLDYLNGNLDILPGEKPTIADWENHLSTIFTEVRVKKFIEVRGADAGNWRRTCALPAFWVGILYGEDSLVQAQNICAKWTIDDIEKLSNDVSKLGLNAVIRGETVLSIAKDLIEISRRNLIKRDIKDSVGSNESIYLNVLEDILQKKCSPAGDLLKQYNEKYDKDMEKLLRSIAY